ncbi:MAG: hypothetical protein ACRDIV_13640, partial [Ktedonobacteraceae bacterium]
MRLIGCVIIITGGVAFVNSKFTLLQGFSQVVGGKQGDRQGRLYLRTAWGSPFVVIVEATLAVA